MPGEKKNTKAVTLRRKLGRTGGAVVVSEKGFIVCPRCGKRTKVKIQPNTVLKRFPLFCPWCKKETTIDT